MDATSARDEAAQRLIAELRARLPKHSVPAAMMLELVELEEELNVLLDGGAARTTPESE